MTTVDHQTFRGPSITTYTATDLKNSIIRSKGSVNISGLDKLHFFSSIIRSKGSVNISGLDKLHFFSSIIRSKGSVNISV